MSSEKNYSSDQHKNFFEKKLSDIDPDILIAGFQWLMTKRNGFYGLPEVLAG